MRRWMALLLALAGATLACNTFFPPRPDVAWDPDPAALVIELYSAGGLVPATFMDNYIPAARVWGDGRIIWTTFPAGGSRRVLIGQLTPDELRALLQQFVEAGFFGWQDFYEPPYQIYDGATTTLTVQLQSTSKSVSEYMEGAPAQFHTLGGQLASGAGAAGTDYVPERGYLRAYPLGAGSEPAQFVWPAERFGFGLAEAAGAGRAVDGEALQFAWTALNQAQFASFASDGQLYTLTLQVPGVSYLEPPAP